MHSSDFAISHQHSDGAEDERLHAANAHDLELFESCDDHGSEDGDGSRPVSRGIFWLHHEETLSEYSFSETPVDLASGGGIAMQRLYFEISPEVVRMHPVLSPVATKTDCLLGLCLEALEDGSLFVRTVEVESQVRCTADGDPGICPGDTIVEVDVVQCVSAGLQERLGFVARFGGDLEIVVRRRPPLFEVELKPDHESFRLGLSIGISVTDPYRIKVRQIQNTGLAAAWNLKHDTSRICAGDWIVKVNGHTRPAKKMYAAMLATEQGSTLRLLIATPQRHIYQPDLQTIYLPSRFDRLLNDDLSPDLYGARVLADGHFLEASRVVTCRQGA
jgi:hypothetical protein